MLVIEEDREKAVKVNKYLVKKGYRQQQNHKLWEYMIYQLLKFDLLYNYGVSSVHPYIGTQTQIAF